MASPAMLVLAGLLCVCLGAQAASFGRPMRLDLSAEQKPVVAHLNLNNNNNGDVVARLNPEALARVSGEAVVGRLNMDAVKKASNEPVVARLNPEAVARITGEPIVAFLDVEAVQKIHNKDDVVVARLNPEAVARITGQRIVAHLDIEAVQKIHTKEEPVVMRLNPEAVAKLSGKPLVARLDIDAVQKPKDEPVVMELNTAALKNKLTSQALNNLQAVEMGDIEAALKSVLPERVSAFSYSDCGAASNAGHVQQLSITPDPIQIPGNITVSLKASLATNETAPIKAAIKLQKKSKIGTWNTIPCIDNIGSCTYDDLCELLAKNIPLVDGQCPPEFIEHNAPCRCPIPAAALSIPGLSIAIPKLPPSIPSFLVQGDFQVNVQLTGSNGAQILCLNIALTLA